jgi:hypothetical protein
VIVDFCTGINTKKFIFVNLIGVLSTDTKAANQFFFAFSTGTKYPNQIYKNKFLSIYPVTKRPYLEAKIFCKNLRDAFDTFKRIIKKK